MKKMMITIIKGERTEKRKKRKPIKFPAVEFLIKCKKLIHSQTINKNISKI